jgi:hypothetical protein
MLRPDAALSILVRNRNGEVLKEAIKSRDWKLATANLTAETVVDTLYGEADRYLAPRRHAICSIERDWKLSPKMASAYFLTTWGIENLTDAKYAQIFALESTLGARPEFTVVALVVRAYPR